MFKTLWFLPIGLIILIGGSLTLTYHNSVNLGGYLPKVQARANRPSRTPGYFSVTPTVATDNISVEYNVDGAARVILRLLDTNGQEVDKLMDRNVGDGFFQTTFDVSEKYFPGT